MEAARNLLRTASLPSFGNNFYKEHRHFEVFRSCFESVGLNSTELRMLHKHFAKIDNDSSNYISRIELLMYLDVENTTFSKRVFGCFDKDASDTIDFKEFAMTTGRYCTCDKEALISFTFDVYDQDNGGLIDVKEIQNLLKDWYGESFGQNRAAVAIVQALEEKEEPVFSLQQFKHFVRNHELIMFPVFTMQRKICEKIGGLRFWQKVTKRRKSKIISLGSVMKKKETTQPDTSAAVPPETNKTQAVLSKSNNNAEKHVERQNEESSNSGNPSQVIASPANKRHNKVDLTAPTSIPVQINQRHTSEAQEDARGPPQTSQGPEEGASAASAVAAAAAPPNDKHPPPHASTPVPVHGIHLGSALHTKVEFHPREGGAAELKRTASHGYNSANRKMSGPSSTPRSLKSGRVHVGPSESDHQTDSNKKMQHAEKEGSSRELHHHHHHADKDHRRHSKEGANGHRHHHHHHHHHQTDEHHRRHSKDTSRGQHHHHHTDAAGDHQHNSTPSKRTGRRVSVDRPNTAAARGPVAAGGQTTGGAKRRLSRDVCRS